MALSVLSGRLRQASLYHKFITWVFTIHRLGLFIACYPKSTIAAAIVVSGLLGIGLINYNQSRDLEGKIHNMVLA